VHGLGFRELLRSDVTIAFLCFKFGVRGLKFRV